MAARKINYMGRQKRNIIVKEIEQLRKDISIYMICTESLLRLAKSGEDETDDEAERWIDITSKEESNDIIRLKHSDFDNVQVLYDAKTCKIIEYTIELKREYDTNMIIEHRDGLIELEISNSKDLEEALNTLLNRDTIALEKVDNAYKFKGDRNLAMLITFTNRAEEHKYDLMHLMFREE